ncbi:MAG: hypothetical protein FWD72_02235 [Eggerthellaceae bacterium]|nr:hypothetical protein [Eggerthellaceae bacterium]
MRVGIDEPVDRGYAFPDELVAKVGRGVDKQALLAFDKRPAAPAPRPGVGPCLLASGAGTEECRDSAPCPRAEEREAMTARIDVGLL